MNNVDTKPERKTYVCRRARMCSYLVERGFFPYKITPDKDNPKFNVYLFSATPQLYTAVMDYVASKQNDLTTEGDNNDGRSNKERI